MNKIIINKLYWILGFVLIINLLNVNAYVKFGESFNFTSNNTLIQNATGSLGQWEINFSVAENESSVLTLGYMNFSIIDSFVPRIIITTPSDGGSVSSQSVTTNIDLSDNVELSNCTYSIYSSATEHISNTSISNPSSNTSFTFTTSLGCSGISYTLRVACFDNISSNQNQVSSTYTCTTPSPGGGSPGGGGGTSTLSALSIGAVCTSNDQCSSNLCDLSIGSSNYGTCVNTLCGNGIKDEGESFYLCNKDFQFEGTGVAGAFIKFIPYLLGTAFLLLFLSSNNGDIKKKWEKSKKWIKGLSKNG